MNAYWLGAGLLVLILLLWFLERRHAGDATLRRQAIRKECQGTGRALFVAIAAGDDWAVRAVELIRHARCPNHVFIGVPSHSGRHELKQRLASAGQPDELAAHVRLWPTTETTTGMRTALELHRGEPFVCVLGSSKATPRMHGWDDELRDSLNYVHNAVVSSYLPAVEQRSLPGYPAADGERHIDVRAFKKHVDAPVPVVGLTQEFVFGKAGEMLALCNASKTLRPTYEDDVSFTAAARRLRLRMYGLTLTVFLTNAPASQTIVGAGFPTRTEVPYGSKDGITAHASRLEILAKLGY
jgi:hypothetical protein